VSEVIDVYLEIKDKVDLWAKEAPHPVLRAFAKVFRDEAQKQLKELQKEG